MWYEIWTAYHPQGLEIAVPAGGSFDKPHHPASVLSAIRVGIRIDISSATPFSKYAQQQALDGLFERGAITFAEYVGAMEDDNGLPKGKRWISCAPGPPRGAVRSGRRARGSRGSRQAAIRRRQQKRRRFRQSAANA